MKSCHGSRWQSWWNLRVDVCVRACTGVCAHACVCVCVYRWGVGAGQCQHYGRAVIRPTTEHVPGQCHAHRRKQPPNKRTKEKGGKREGQKEIEREKTKNPEKEVKSWVFLKCVELNNSLVIMLSDSWQWSSDAPLITWCDVVNRMTSRSFFKKPCSCSWNIRRSVGQRNIASNWEATNGKPTPRKARVLENGPGRLGQR